MSNHRQLQQTAVSVPTFIVGTGRCGSTMLSNMVREHPPVLSVSEFFSVVMDFYAYMSQTFSPQPIDGRKFWEIAAAIRPFVSFGRRHGIRCAEQFYPFESPPARFSSQSGVPAILITTLPYLTDDYDAFFDVLRDELTAWPSAPIARHYKHLFDYLAKHFGKWLWVERSGGILGIAGQLITAYPDARFIHVVRDGRDAALSMREHELHRLALVMSALSKHLGVDPMASSDRTRIERVPAELLAFLPERFDSGALKAYRFPVTLYCEHWAQQIMDGLNVLSSLPEDRVLTLRYEDFFTDPKRQLDTFAAFSGDDFMDDAWSTRCAATVRKPKSTWRDLPEETARALTEACRPGLEALREAGIS